MNRLKVLMKLLLKEYIERNHEWPESCKFIYLEDKSMRKAGRSTGVFYFSKIKEFPEGFQLSREESRAIVLIDKKTLKAIRCEYLDE